MQRIRPQNNLAENEQVEKDTEKCPECPPDLPPEPHCPPCPPEPPCPPPKPIPPGPPSTDLVGRVYAPTYVSAYGIAVKYGYIGTEEEWIHSLEGKSEHDLLIHREYPDSHPIEAISGLEDNLDEIDEDIDDLTIEVSKKQDTMLPMTAREVMDICV